MKIQNTLINRKLLIVSIFLALLVIIFLFQTNIVTYFTLGDYPDGVKPCHNKKMIWDKSIYLIDKTPQGKKIVLKVETRNTDAWYEVLKPVESPDEQFTTCVKGVTKYPAHVEQAPHAGKELLTRSKGLEISIGIMDPLRYSPIAFLTTNVELYASKFNDDSYNLDVAIQNIADNYVLIQDADAIWRLSFKSKIAQQVDHTLPFYYNVVQINGKEISNNTKVEFVSKDDGVTWRPVLEQTN